jgi:hypothetical protein
MTYKKFHKPHKKHHKERKEEAWLALTSINPSTSKAARSKGDATRMD